MAALSSFERTVRHAVYAHFVQRGKAPSVAETAHHLHESLQRIRNSYHSLHNHHALFLQPGTDQVLMANPFSAVSTPFQVHPATQSYWANCAWDLIAIPAMLNEDATLAANCADCQTPITLAVKNGRLHHHNELVHFAVPFHRWYDDLIFT